MHHPNNFNKTENYGSARTAAAAGHGGSHHGPAASGGDGSDTMQRVRLLLLLWARVSFHSVCACLGLYGLASCSVCARVDTCPARSLFSCSSRTLQPHATPPQPTPTSNNQTSLAPAPGWAQPPAAMQPPQKQAVAPQQQPPPSRRCRCASRRRRCSPTVRACPSSGWAPTS